MRAVQMQAAPDGQRTAARGVRRSEWVIAAFFVFAAALAMSLPVAAATRARIVALNFGLLAAYAAVLRAAPARYERALSIARDWMPLVLILLAYRETGWFARPHRTHALESHWVVWDRMILRGGAASAIEAFGPVVPSILEIAYALVYLLPILALIMLYVYGRRAQADRFLFVLTLAVLFSYAQFPFWPSDPPRAIFFGQDFPAYNTIFRRFNLWMLGTCGIHTSVFPSAHVAGAFATAFGTRLAMPNPKWASRSLFAAALLIGIATVYGRYHYSADAAAGFAMAVAAVAAGRTATLPVSRLAAERAEPRAPRLRAWEAVRPPETPVIELRHAVPAGRAVAVVDGDHHRRQVRGAGSAGVSRAAGS